MNSVYSLTAQQQSNQKSAASLGMTIDGELPAHGASQGPRDRQPQANPAGPATAVGLQTKIPFKEFFPEGRVDAGPVVFYHQHYLSRFAFQPGVRDPTV